MSLKLTGWQVIYFLVHFPVCLIVAFNLSSNLLVYSLTINLFTINSFTCLLKTCLLYKQYLHKQSYKGLFNPLSWTTQSVSPKRRKFRAISSARLWHRCLYTCTLSTSSSTTTLNGVLILRLASHLDAFSAYPFQTQIPSGAPGGTTGKPEVCPSRSSRTSDGTTQNSRAHDR